MRSGLHPSTYLEGANGCPAVALPEEQKRYWLQKLSTAPDGIWSWCTEQDQETLLRLLAYCVSRTINGVKSKSDAENNSGRLQEADALATALQFDMTKWFTPTADNFFGRVPKSRIVQALTESGKQPSGEVLRLKKPDLAALAEMEAKGTGWLPDPIRISGATGHKTKGLDDAVNE